MPTQDVKPPYWLQISEAAQTLAHTLLERYPATFCADPAAVRPLKIGIDRDIQQALDVPPTVVTEVMRRYTRHRRTLLELNWLQVFEGIKATCSRHGAG